MRKTYNVEKMYTYLKGFAQGANMPETLKALAYARRKHEGQLRKNGEPYFVHPLTMACNAIAIGIKDDFTIAAILLHDVPEDCDVPFTDLPVCDITKGTVKLLTFEVKKGETKDIAKNRYYNAILEDWRAVLGKAIDRCHNVSSMAGTFTTERLWSYIHETRDYVLPMLKAAKDLYPEMSNLFFILTYHITSVVDSIEATLLANEEVKNG